MLSLQQIARILGGEVVGRQVLCPGPNHSHHDRSLSVRLTGLGNDFIVHSHCGDAFEDCKDYVRAKLDMPAWQAQEKAARPRLKTRKPVATYDYRDEAGELLFQVCRYELPGGKKTFSQRRPDGRGGFINSLDLGAGRKVRQVLYRMVDLKAFPDASPVIVVEGEKDADAVTKLGMVATTISGAAKWSPELAEPLRGRDVVILPDCDDEGEKKAAAAMAALAGIAKTVKLVRLPGLPHKGDVSDYLETGKTAEDLIAVIMAAPEIKAPSAPIIATPYAWKDPKTIISRDWLYGRVLIRQYVSATVAPGGLGKTSLVTVEALAMVSGKMLLGVLPEKQLRVWLWNLEDPQEETERKIQAAALRYELTPDDIGDRLFVDSGRDQSLVIATETKDGVTIMKPVVDAIVAEIIKRKIDVVIIDPFVCCHEVQENDNTAQNMIVGEWKKVADRANCAVHLVDHTRKMGNETEVTLESMRGAKSKTDACRVVRVVNRMTEKEGEQAGIEQHRLYFRTYNDKGNHAPPADKSDWYKLVNVDLGNDGFGRPSDQMGVVTRWDWPDPLAGMSAADFDKVAARIRAGKWRAHPQAKDWAGKAVAEALGISIADKAGRAKVSGMLGIWLNAGSLIEVEGEDDKRMARKFIEVRD
jgi:hypothetical protein